MVKKILQKGFTLVELILVIAIFTVVFGATTTIQTRLLSNTYINTHTDRVIQQIKIASMRSIAGYNNSSWGVYFGENSSTTVFKGEDYDTRDISFDNTDTLPSSLTITSTTLNSGNNYILFSKNTGETLDYGSIAITNAQGKTKTIYINYKGVVGFTQLASAGTGAPGGDITAPAPVMDLVASNSTLTSIDLAWTASGDDGAIGTATGYDVRYSTSIINEANWATATAVSGEPIPSIAGTSETMTISGLNSSTIYYFGIKVADEVPNESTLSNIPLFTTSTATTIFHETFPNADSKWNGSTDTAQDESVWGAYQGDGDTNDVQVSDEDKGAVSPSGGTHLTLEDSDEGFQNPEIYGIAYIPINLSAYTNVIIDYYWQSDDVDAGEGLRVAYSTNSTDGIDGTWTQMAEYLNTTDDIWNYETYSLPDIDATSNFILRFSSKANSTREHMYIDDITLTGVSSGYAPDLVAPGQITTLATSNISPSTMDLLWTAPGDDGAVGTATSYDIRYATSVVTDATWASATQLTGEPLPSIAGSSESITVAGLTDGTTYYFGIKSIDDQSNESVLSNIANGTTISYITIFHETFPNADSKWNGSTDTAQDESIWGVYQGNGDTNDVQISDEDKGTASPSGGTHLTLEDADHGFQNPEIYDIAYIPIDLSLYSNITINYYWQSDDVDNGEGMRVAYSVDSTNGTNGTWIQIAEYLNTPDDIWNLETFNLPDIDAASSFTLRFSSKSNKTGEHMYIDDITILGTN